MTKLVKIQAVDGIVDILENEICKYETITSLIKDIDDKPETLIIEVKNFSAVYYAAVAEYTRNVAPWSVEHAHSVDTIAQFTPKESEFIDKLKTMHDARGVFGVAHYLGNKSCLMFAARMILKHVIISGLYNGDETVSQNPICEANTK